MNDAQVTALLTAMRRIADALEESNRHNADHEASQVEQNRLLAEHTDIARRNIEAAELHNTLHLAGKAHQVTS